MCGEPAGPTENPSPPLKWCLISTVCVWAMAGLSIPIANYILPLLGMRGATYLRGMVVVTQLVMGVTVLFAIIGFRRGAVTRRWLIITLVLIGSLEALSWALLGAASDLARYGL